MIFMVDYLVRNKEQFQTEQTPHPKYVVAAGFDDALKTARKFETDNLSLLEVKLAVADGQVAIARGFKGV